jgi:DNA modification methylase
VRLFSKQGEAVLDPFCGVGSTLKACALSRRKGTGIELNDTFCRLGKDRIAAEIKSTEAQREQAMLCGDARKIVQQFDDNAFSFILTSPPYWSILSKPPGTNPTTRFRKGSVAYGSDKRDFGCIEYYDDFVDELTSFIDSLKRVLQPRRYMAVMVADFRHGEMLYALQADLITAIRKLNVNGDRRLVLQGIKIIAQNHKKLYPYGFPTTYVPNIHHHYVLIFRNIVAAEPKRTGATIPRVQGEASLERPRLAAKKPRVGSATGSTGKLNRRRNSKKPAGIGKKR